MTLQTETVQPSAQGRGDSGPRSFHVMAKPVAAACNLACSYCYYLRRPGIGPSRRMSRDVLEAFVRDTLAAQADLPEVHFSWQGGEPLLAGLDFFREALALQERFRPAGVRVVNALQTNGTLLDAQWARFFSEHRFLLGISIDGPARFHDPLRRDARGRASHAKALRGLEAVQRWRVEFNTLTVVHRLNYRNGLGVYRFLRRIGVRHMQFIPLVERFTRIGEMAAPLPADADADMAPWTAPPEGFGQFLCDVFDEWLAHDVGSVFVQLFEEHVAALARLPADICVFSTDCSSTPILEANGDLYSCDHYAYSPYRLGNILETPIGELVRSERQRGFGRRKLDPLPEDCTRCEFLVACLGGCPKHRFAESGSSGRMRNYLCPSYRLFFRHTAPALARFAAAAGASSGPASTAPC